MDPKQCGETYFFTASLICELDIIKLSFNVLLTGWWCIYLPEVDRPFVDEDPAEVEGAEDVVHRVLQEEGEAGQ